VCRLLERRQKKIRCAACRAALLGAMDLAGRVYRGPAAFGLVKAWGVRLPDFLFGDMQTNKFR